MPQTISWDPICTVAEVWYCSEHYLWLFGGSFYLDPFTALYCCHAVVCEVDKTRYISGLLTWSVKRECNTVSWWFRPWIKLTPEYPFKVILMTFLCKLFFFFFKITHLQSLWKGAKQIQHQPSPHLAEWSEALSGWFERLPLSASPHHWASDLSPQPLCRTLVGHNASIFIIIILIQVLFTFSNISIKNGCCHRFASANKSKSSSQQHFHHYHVHTLTHPCLTLR